MAAVFVTTMDNPWDYFTQFDEWYAYDTGANYDTLNYVARIVAEMTDTPMSEMTDEESEFIINEAVDRICSLNITGNYKKIYDKRKTDEKTE